VKKQKKTIQSKYGVDFLFQLKEWKEVAKKSMLEKYNVEYPIQLQKFKDKKIETCLEIYGKPYPQMTDQVKQKIVQTCLEKYGETNVSKVPEIMDKILKNSKKRKDYQMPSGEIIYLQGYEPFALDFILKEENISEKDIISDRKEVPKIYWYDLNNIQHRYFVDFYIPSQNRMIEVKSDYLLWRDLLEVETKKQTCIDAGYIYDIYVFHHCKKFLMIV